MPALLKLDWLKIPASNTLSLICMRSVLAGPMLKKWVLMHDVISGNLEALCSPVWTGFFWKGLCAQDAFHSRHLFLSRFDSVTCNLDDLWLLNWVGLNRWREDRAKHLRVGLEVDAKAKNNIYIYIYIDKKKTNLVFLCLAFQHLYYTKSFLHRVDVRIYLRSDVSVFKYLYVQWTQKEIRACEKFI